MLKTVVKAGAFSLNFEKSKKIQKNLIFFKKRLDFYKNICYNSICYVMR